MFTSFYKIFKKWVPSPASRSEWEGRLSRFYKNCESYHAMTAGPGKEDHPQVKLLRCLVKPGGTYAEVGCGGGLVSRCVGREAMVYGFDISPIAVKKAAAAVRDEQVMFRCADGTGLPLQGGVVDGCYSFEVLEHTWDPEAVIREMVRVTRPGGFIFISIPNCFSLDLHLPKKGLVRMAEYCCAALRYGYGVLTHRTYWNVKPDLDGAVYPDCDLITALNPMKITSMFERLGCRVEFVDSTYMCATREAAETDLEFQRNTSRPFVRHFGDHFLILAYKDAEVGA